MEIAFDIKRAIRSIENDLFEFRHELHRHPELSGQETRTAGLIRRELDKLGLCWRAVGGTGTLAELSGALPGAKIILRADIDALPVTERSRCPFPSEIPGVMHACGHDVHTAALLGAVKLLTQCKDRLCGTVLFVFQHAEELGHGSQHFISEGVTDGVSRVYGFHVAPDAPIGSAIITNGIDAASCDHMRIKIRGKGAHIAKPQLGHDATLAAADIALRLRELPAQADPLERLLIGIGRISSGNTWNVISDYAEIEGTVRTLSMSAREKLLRAAKDTIRLTAELHGVAAEAEFELHTPCLINDDAAYKTMYSAAAKALGGCEKLINKPVPFGFAGDDFAAFSERVPGCFIHIGTAIEGEADTSAPLHSDNYFVRDEVISVGCEVLLQCALDTL